MRIKTVQALGPFGVGAAQPVAHWEQALEVKARGPALAVAAPTDKTGLLEHLEVLGDGGLSQRGGLSKLDDPGLPGCQALEDRPSSGVGKCREGEAQGVATRHCR